MRRENLLRRSLYPLLREAGLPRVTFHDLRHSGATLVAESGANLKALQERLGHSKFSTTAEIYMHLTPSMQHDVAARLEELFPSLAGVLAGVDDDREVQLG